MCFCHRRVRCARCAQAASFVRGETDIDKRRHSSCLFPIPPKRIKPVLCAKCTFAGLPDIRNAGGPQLHFVDCRAGPDVPDGIPIRNDTPLRDQPRNSNSDRWSDRRAQILRIACSTRADSARTAAAAICLPPFRANRRELQQRHPSTGSARSIGTQSAVLTPTSTSGSFEINASPAPAAPAAS